MKSDSELFTQDYANLDEETRNDIIRRLSKSLLRWAKVRGDHAYIELHAHDLDEGKALEKESNG